MGTYVFKLPDVGEGIAQAEIVAWHVEVGDTVREDQHLVDVMTDKATVEIGSPVAGRILARSGEAGDMASVGAQLVSIETGAGDGQESGKPSPVVKPSPVIPPPAPAVQAPVPAQAPSPPPAPTGVGQEPPAPQGKATASPAVRARAAALGLDLGALPGSGPYGQVRHEDLDRWLVARATAVPTPVRARREGVEEVRVIGLRRRIAERMQEAVRRIPHFAYVEEVDVTALEALRKDLNETRPESSARVTLLPFLIRALAAALLEHPGLNAHFDDEAGIIRRHASMDVGIATQTPRGLLVPVIRHAEALDVFGLASEIVRLSEAARSGKSNREELTGSTITVTSLGALGGLAATPIINPPEVAIIGVNKIVERPVFRDGQVVAAKLMNLSSSFDHRVIDGFDAAAFIQSVRLGLESPGRLLVG
jgi:2-oxoisovalerate dehydrogenase E2 component (dihydrolipoyl transacylase)